MAEHRFSSRKLIVVAVAFITGIALSYFKLLNEVTANFIITMTAIYLAGNVGMGFADVIRTFKENSNSQ